MKTVKTGCDLGTCLMCRLCEKEWLPAIGAHRQNFSFKKGETIFREGEMVNGIYFVFSGTVKVHKRWGEDKDLIVRFAKKGDIVGHRGLGSDLMYPVSGTAIEPTTVCYISLDFFKSSLKVSYSFIYELMQFFASELKETERNMRNLAHMPVRGRIGQALLTLDQKFGVTPDGFLDINISRNDLASFAGTTYETVFRVMNEMVLQHIITIEGKRIRILNRAGLKDMTESA